MDEVLVRTIALACPVEHAFDVFTDKIDLWWPRGHRRNRDASLTLTDMALIERAPDGSTWTMGEVTAKEPMFETPNAGESADTEERKAQPVPEIRPVLQSTIIHEPVRSGQSIIFPEGDVTVIGSVASGAEVIAGGSVHIYGTVRGRVLTGSLGNRSARIFCRKLEAEMLAIDGIYIMAEDMDPSFRGQAVQLWLEGDVIMAEILS